MAIDKCDQDFPHAPHEHNLQAFWGTDICPGRPETAADQVLYSTVAAALNTAASAGREGSEDHAEGMALYKVETYFRQFATDLLELGQR